VNIDRMARRIDSSSRGAQLLELLRSATEPVSLDDLRAAGISRPAAAVYELQLDGHRITRSPAGLELDEGPARPPETWDIPPRVRVRRRDEG
jgi:hypothetical protein